MEAMNDPELSPTAMCCPDRGLLYAMYLWAWQDLLALIDTFEASLRSLLLMAFLR